MEIPRHKAKPTRAGFSMVELLAVILIILILMALLVPTLGRAIITTRTSQVRVDITALETALANFKNEFGIYPPSEISIYAKQDGWNGDVRSKALIRKMWPQFDFVTDRSSRFPSGVTQFNLCGPECLVFFLGGVYPSGSARNMRGFSKNPSDPFAEPTGTETRVGPFHEFQASRLVDMDNDGFYEYLDPLPNQTHPYLYASSYDGHGYRATELASLITQLSLTSVMQQKDTQSTPVFSNDFYRQSRDGAYYNQKTFQLISPGTPTANVGAPYGYGDSSTDIYDAVFNPEDTTNISEEGGNNITNFNQGTLK